MASASASRGHSLDKFSWDRSVHGDVTVIVMRGTLSNAFEGKKLAAAITTRSVVMVMREVRRFASWGMAEWMEFLRILGEKDVYMVECSTYAVSQLNLVTGLLGHAKLVSFYAAYRCSSCNAASDSLFLIPRDRNIIRSLPESEYQCSSCGGAARLEEYPAAFFDTIANRDAFDIEDDVLALMRTRFKYDLAPDITRFRAVGVVGDAHAYMRLTGSLTRLLPDKLTWALRPTTVVDLERTIFDGSGVDEWRAFYGAASAKVKSLQLVGCPSGFLETAVQPQDLRDKLKIRSFVATYHCVQCAKDVETLVDVADNLEDLVQGKIPNTQCAKCKATQFALTSPELVARIKILPARDREPELEKLVTKARSEPDEKLSNLLVARPPKPVAPPSAGRAGLYTVLTLVILVLGGVAYFAIDAWRTQHTQQPVVVATPDAAEKPKFVRPEWITSDGPSSAYCHDMINRLMCVGVSSYRTNRDDAASEASDAALEELVHTIGLKIADPFFKEQVVSRYGDARNKLLAALHSAEVERGSDTYKAALDVVRKARQKVVTALRTSGGPAVPSQRSDWYWEEYAGENGAPNEQLVFVRYDVNLDAVRALLERYAIPTTISGTSFVTTFPGLAWQPADLGGVMVTVPGRKLARAGVKPQDFIVAVGDEPLADASQLARSFDKASKADAELQLDVRGKDEPPKRIKVRL